MTHTNLDGKSSLSMKLIQGSTHLVIKDTLKSVMLIQMRENELLVYICRLLTVWLPQCYLPRTTDTQWRHKSKISEKLGRSGRQNMLPPYLKIWDWDWIFGRVVKPISSLGVRSPWKFIITNEKINLHNCLDLIAIYTSIFHFFQKCNMEKKSKNLK